MDDTQPSSPLFVSHQLFEDLQYNSAITIEQELGYQWCKPDKIVTSKSGTDFDGYVVIKTSVGPLLLCKVVQWQCGSLRGGIDYRPVLANELPVVNIEG